MCLNKNLQQLYKKNKVKTNKRRYKLNDYSKAILITCTRISMQSTVNTEELVGAKFSDLVLFRSRPF